MELVAVESVQRGVLAPHPGATVDAANPIVWSIFRGPDTTAAEVDLQYYADTFNNNIRPIYPCFSFRADPGIAWTWTTEGSQWSSNPNGLPHSTPYNTICITKMLTTWGLTVGSRLFLTPGSPPPWGTALHEAIHSLTMNNAICENSSTLQGCVEILMAGETLVSLANSLCIPCIRNTSRAELQAAPVRISGRCSTSRFSIAPGATMRLMTTVVNVGVGTAHSYRLTFVVDPPDTSKPNMTLGVFTVNEPLASGQKYEFAHDVQIPADLPPPVISGQLGSICVSVEVLS